MKATIEQLKESINAQIECAKTVKDLQSDATNRRIYSERITTLLEIKDEIAELERLEDEEFFKNNFPTDKQAKICVDIADTFKDIHSTLVGIAEGEKEAIKQMSKARYKRPTKNELNTNK
jgi:hypothetical protein